MAARIDLELQPNGEYQVSRICEDRGDPKHTPRDITSSLHKYLPFDVSRSVLQSRENIFGWKVFQGKMKSGSVPLVRW